MSKSAFIIYSIFGQIEEIAAKMMIEDGMARLIPFEQIPEQERENEFGHIAKFAVAITGRANNRKFDRLIRDLRA